MPINKKVVTGFLISALNLKALDYLNKQEDPKQLYGALSFWDITQRFGQEMACIFKNRY